MTEQVVYDLFNQNLILFQHFINAVVAQQREIRADARPLKNDQHLISISLHITQKMMFLYPNLMKVFSEFPQIDHLIQIVFLKIETEKIQQKVAQTFVDICKKLDNDLVQMHLRSAPQAEAAASSSAVIPNEVIVQLPSVFFMRLFWNKCIE